MIFLLKLSGFNRSHFSFILMLLSLFPDADAGASSLILDRIDIVAIQDMQLRKEKGGYLMDVLCTIRNSGKNTLKFKKCRFDLGFALKDADDVRLGTASEEKIFLRNKGESAYTDTDVRFTADLGSDIRTFHHQIISSDELSSLLTDPKPKLNLHIRGNFVLGIQLTQGWMYQSGIRIDWTLALDVSRDVFVSTYKTIESAAGEGREESDDADHKDSEWLDDSVFE